MCSSSFLSVMATAIAMENYRSDVRGPDPAELVDLLEKQDAIMDSLQAELDMCKEHILILANADKQRTETEQASTALTAEAEEKIRAAISTVEALHVHNGKLEKEIIDLRQKLIDDRPVATVIQMREKVKEIEFELEREKRSKSVLQLKLDEQSMEHEQLKHEMTVGLAAKEATCSSLTAKLEAATKELAQTKFQLEGVISDRDQKSSRMGCELEILTQKEQHLDALCKQLSQEVSFLRKERSVMSSRLSALKQENVSLRTQAVKKNLDDTLFNGGDAEEQMSKLLTDQRHLIAALREEGRLLADRLEEERRESKLKMREIKKEKQELEDRLAKVLKI